MAQTILSSKGRVISIFDRINSFSSNPRHVSYAEESASYDSSHIEILP